MAFNYWKVLLDIVFTLLEICTESPVLTGSLFLKLGKIYCAIIQTVLPGKSTRFELSLDNYLFKNELYTAWNNSVKLDCLLESHCLTSLLSVATVNCVAGI